MKIEEEKKEGATLFTLSGRLDSNTSTKVESTLLETIGKGESHIILDFSSLDYISSAGIRLLVHCNKELEKKGGYILLAAVPKPIENVLYITGFLPYFKVFDSKTGALEALKKAKH